MSISVGSFVFSQLNISIEEPVTVDDLEFPTFKLILCAFAVSVINTKSSIVKMFFVFMSFLL